MRLRKTYLLSILILIVLEGTLILLVPILKSHQHPLLSDLTCKQTDNRDDLYWNMNPKTIRGKHDFRFENDRSPKVSWLRKHALPLMAQSDGQWEKYIAIGRWVREQIPFKDPVMKSCWDAQRILQAVWTNPSIGFLCDAFAATYVSACISVGLHARMIHLDSVEGYGHYATEIWSDDYQKWVFMDPLYGCYFMVEGVPLSTLELHDLWKDNRWESAVAEYDGEDARVSTGASRKEYGHLFRDIQFINSNDFLSNPLNSFSDLITMKIRYVRWVDESNPRHNKMLLAIQLVFFYYLPKVSEQWIVPILIPVSLLLLSLLLLHDVYRQSSHGSV